MISMLIRLLIRISFWLRGASVIGRPFASRRGYRVIRRRRIETLAKNSRLTTIRGCHGKRRSKFQRIQRDPLDAIEWRPSALIFSETNVYDRIRWNLDGM